MRRVQPRRPNLAAALIAGLASFAPTRAHAYCRLTTEMPSAGECSNKGKPLYWARQCLGYSVVPREADVPSLEEIRTVVDVSFATWNEVECNGARVGIELEQTIGTAECVEPEYNPDGPNANSVIFVTDWVERGLPREAFGLTLVWHQPQTGEIFDADLQINDGELGDLAICKGTPPKCGPNQVDIQNVVTHEAGHYLGLGHTLDDPLATMAARALLGETSKRTLANDDREGLCAIYGDNEPSACRPEDFQPDNGFAASCYFAEPNGIGCGACGVVGASRPLARFAFAPVMITLALAYGRYRWRRRVTASSSTPSPTNR